MLMGRPLVEPLYIGKEECNRAGGQRRHGKSPRGNKVVLVRRRTRFIIALLTAPEKAGGAGVGNSATYRSGATGVIHERMTPVIILVDRMAQSDGSLVVIRWDLAWGGAALHKAGHEQQQTKPTCHR